jgi:cob(I)alamin adenosyltransferase
LKVYTRTGDDGTTGLFGAGRVSKSHPRIEAYGTVDEANACLGMARAAIAFGARHEGPRVAEADALLARLQNELFVLGGDLSAPRETAYPVPRVEIAHIAAIEADIDRLTADLPPLKHFVLPGGTPAAAAVHLARTVARRAERLTVDLAAAEPVSAEALHYLNRLSDLLFTLARWLTHDAGAPEPVWAPVDERAAAGTEAEVALADPDPTDDDD